MFHCYKVYSLLPIAIPTVIFSIRWSGSLMVLSFCSLSIRWVVQASLKITQPHLEESIVPHLISQCFFLVVAMLVQFYGLHLCLLGLSLRERWSDMVKTVILTQLAFFWSLKLIILRYDATGRVSVVTCTYTCISSVL